jgi:hypothetical protein
LHAQTILHQQTDQLHRLIARDAAANPEDNLGLFTLFHHRLKIADPPWGCKLLPGAQKKLQNWHHCDVLSLANLD